MNYLFLQIHFQRRDPGEHSESFDKKWKADEEPISSTMDSWASHCIPVVPHHRSNLSPCERTVPKTPKKHVSHKKRSRKVSGVPYTRETDDVRFFLSLLKLFIYLLFIFI